MNRAYAAREEGLSPRRKSLVISSSRVFVISASLLEVLRRFSTNFVLDFGGGFPAKDKPRNFFLDLMY